MDKIKYTAFALMTVLLCGCDSNDKKDIPSGYFEATEVTVSAAQTGQLLDFSVIEGQKVNAGQQVGLIDTVQLQLQAKQMGISRASIESQKPDAQKQTAALEKQLSEAENNSLKMEDMYNNGAASQKQMNDAKAAVDILRKQISAQKSVINNSTKSLSGQSSTMSVQKAQVIDLLRKCHITSPISGVVLEKYTEAGEMAVIGKPLFRVADTRTMYLRAYITAEEYTKLKLGQRVGVTCDFGEKSRTYSGTVSWISEAAEFSSKTVDTKEGRNEQVYAIKVVVRNDGFIKIGMYGEIQL